MAGSSNPNVTLVLRVQGARGVITQVEATAAAVAGVGGASKKATVESSLLQRATNGLLTPFRHLKSEAGSLAKSVLGLGAAFVTWRGMKDALDFTHNLTLNTLRLRRMFGFTTQAASELAAVMSVRGIKQTSLEMGLTTLSRMMVNASRGAKTVQKNFALLGISTAEIARDMQTPGGLSTMFQTIVERLTEMPGGQIRAAAAMSLMGRAGRSLSPLLREGALGLKQNIKWAREFGAVLTDKTVGSMEQLTAAEIRADYATAGLKLSIGTFLAPLLTHVLLTFSQIIRSFRDGRAEGGSFSRTVYQIGMDLKPLGELLLAIGKFLKDQPGLLRLAATAWILYKLKVFALLGFGWRTLGVKAGTEMAAGAAATSGWRAIGLGWGALLMGGIIAAIDFQLLDSVFKAYSEQAGSPGETMLERQQQRGRGPLSKAKGHVDNLVRYLRRHPEEVSVGTVESLTPAQRRALGVAIGYGATGGAIVIHTHVHVGPKEVAKTTHRVAVKKKSTR